MSKKHIEKIVLKIKKTNFIEWYFNSGSDQEQRSLVMEMGDRVIENLIADGNYSITAQDIFDECNHEIIPVNLLVGEGYEYSDQEIGDLNLPNWELILI